MLNPSVKGWLTRIPPLEPLTNKYLLRLVKGQGRGNGQANDEMGGEVNTQKNRQPSPVEGIGEPRLDGLGRSGGLGSVSGPRHGLKVVGGPCPEEATQGLFPQGNHLLILRAVE